MAKMRASCGRSDPRQPEAEAGHEEGERRREQELQRIHVEQHDEQQHRVQHRRPGVLQAVLPEEDVVLVPDPGEQGERRRERHEAGHQRHQVVVRLRHVERHDEQRQREREDGVAERFEPRDLVPAHGKHVGRIAWSSTRLVRDPGGTAIFVHHLRSLSTTVRRGPRFASSRLDPVSPVPRDPRTRRFDRVSHVTSPVTPLP